MEVRPTGGVVTHKSGDPPTWRWLWIPRHPPRVGRDPNRVGRDPTLGTPFPYQLIFRLRVQEHALPHEGVATPVGEGGRNPGWGRGS